MTVQDTKQEPPTWLSYIENCIEEEEENFESNAPYYKIIHDLLLRSEAPNEALEQAIKRSYDQYTGEIDDYNSRIDDEDPEPPKRQEYDFNLLDNTMTELVLEMMGELPYLDPKTDMLAKFLIGLNKYTKNMCRKSSGDIISAVREAWDASHADSMSFNADHSGVEGAIHRWLNVASLIAKLYKADLLEDYGQMWVAHDFRRTFEERSDGDITKQPIKQAQVLAVVNYMLIVGEPFAEAAKAGKDEMTAEKWRLWAKEMKKVADVVDESVRWDLKERARKASAMMVELYPRAVE
ncbi:uncharacterized protein B0J16DRAFT_408239 [Fusarium flagelliforme]|uniref:uncharacterized protein n=1 Tax=Fusarium flagelliforme TaxID=2675880 RepID=UPI001E8DFE0B|nr:uncharacterized protein B0J16DRAFT_408239 [Fusarium flagelliforme]KAH7196530.1 hypothetical protein B0J16DRAFT_408239 [Fusarium flagelliforme]